MFILHYYKDGSDTFHHFIFPNEYIYSCLMAFIVFVIQ